MIFDEKKPKKLAKTCTNSFYSSMIINFKQNVVKTGEKCKYKLLFGNTKISHGKIHLTLTYTGTKRQLRTTIYLKGHKNLQMNQ